MILLTGHRGLSFGRFLRSSTGRSRRKMRNTSRRGAKEGYALQVIGLPKTIDNDVFPITQSLGAWTAAEQGAHSRRSAAELLETYEQHGDAFDAWHVGSFWHTLGKHAHVLSNSSVACGERRGDLEFSLRAVPAASVMQRVVQESSLWFCERVAARRPRASAPRRSTRTRTRARPPRTRSRPSTAGWTKNASKLSVWPSNATHAGTALPVPRFIVPSAAIAGAPGGGGGAF